MMGPFVHLLDTRMHMEHWWSDDVRGGIRSAQGSKPGFRGDMPMTNHQIHGRPHIVLGINL